MLQLDWRKPRSGSLNIGSRTRTRVFLGTKDNALIPVRSNSADYIAEKHEPPLPSRAVNARVRRRLSLGCEDQVAVRYGAHPQNGATAPRAIMPWSYVWRLNNRNKASLGSNQ